MENVAIGVFDALLNQWDATIHSMEWGRALSDLEQSFLGDTEKAFRHNAVHNAVCVARGEEWNKLGEFLFLDFFSLRLADRKFFFEQCPTDVLANLVVDEKGLVNVCFNRLKDIEVLADNSEEEIFLLHFAYDALYHLVAYDAEWRERARAAVDMMNRLCLFKGGRPKSLDEKFNSVLRPITQQIQEVPPQPKTAPARTVRETEFGMKIKKAAVA